jgi:hypothetical protein
VRRLNLATEPFRNETLPAVLIVLAGLVLAVVTVRHAFAIRALMPGRTSTAHNQTAAMEAEAARLRAEARNQRVERPAAPVVAQWTLLKELVDRRTFSWTSLFSVLEQTLPPSVRLLTITPRLEKGVLRLELTAATRSYEPGLELIHVLEERPEFADVIPLGRGDEENPRYRYEMRYQPPPAGAAAPVVVAPAPAAGQQPDEGTPGPAARASARLEVHP